MPKLKLEKQKINWKRRIVSRLDGRDLSTLYVTINGTSFQVFNKRLAAKNAAGGMLFDIPMKFIIKYAVIGAKYKLAQEKENETKLQEWKDAQKYGPKKRIQK